MSMGNFLRVWPVDIDVMAASNQPVGVDHVTIVPENFDSGQEDHDADADEDDSMA